jgi:hypothetical protein
LKYRFETLVLVVALCVCCTCAPGQRDHGDSGAADSGTETESGDGPTMTSMPGWNLVFAVRAGGDESTDEIPDGMWRESGLGIEPLDDGSVYLAGQVGDGAVFGEGTATETTFPSWGVGWSDGFLARYRPEGGLDWVRRIGGDSEDHAWGVDAFADGSAVVAGFFDSFELVLGEGESNETVLFTNDRSAYAARYAPTGELDWAVSFPSADDYDVSYARAAFALPDGRTLVAGMFFGTLWPGEPWELTSEPLGSPEGDGDGFLAWLEADGGVLGSRRIGGDTESYWGRQYALSGGGALFAALPYYGEEMFGEGEEHETALHCESDPGECATALARYTTEGSLEWVRSVNAARAGIAAIGEESVGLVGYALDPESFLASEPIWTGVWDTRYIAVAKYGAADGQLEWARFAVLNATPWYFGYPAVVGTPDGGLVALLSFQYSLAFDGDDAGAQEVIADGGATEMALVSFAPDGEIRWVHRLGGAGVDRETSVAQQGGTSLWLTGAYGSDPFVATSGNGDDVPLPLAGLTDVFLLRFDAMSIPAE